MHIEGSVKVKSLPFAQSREIKQTSNTAESIIIGGLDAGFFGDIIAKEKGLSAVLSAILGLGAKKSDFANFSDIQKADNILGIKKDDFTSLITVIKNQVEKVSNIDSTLSKIYDALINTQGVESTNKNGEVINVAVDTSKAKNIESLMKSANFISANDEAAFESLKTLEKFFKKLNKLVDEDGIVTVAVKNVNNVPKLSTQLSQKMGRLTEIFGLLGNISNLDSSKIKEVIGILDEIFKSLNDKLIAINGLNIEENIDSLKTKLEEIRTFYETEIATTADTIVKHAEDLKIINDSVGEAYEVAISADLSIDRDKLEESQADIGGIIDAIAALGLVMLLGGWIINKNKDLIKGSLLFGATLALFLMELMIPIFLITKIGSNKTLEGNIGEVILYVSAMSLIMLIGAWLGSSDKMIKGSLKFGFALTAFLTMITIPINLVIALSDKSGSILASINNITKVILTSAVMMFLGAFLVDSIKIKKALTFGALLATFIFEILTPFIIFGALSRKAFKLADNMTSLIITCSLIMVLGSFIVSNKQLVGNALRFGAVFGAFILFTIAPLLILEKFSDKAEKLIKAVQWYIISASIIMVLGALLVKNKEFVKNALLFGGIFTLFITTTLAPIFIFALFSKITAITLLQLSVFIATSAFIMMVGAYFITSGMWKPALGFGILLTAFVWGVMSPFILFSKQINIAIMNVGQFGIFMLACTASLFIGVYLAKHFFKALVGAAIIVGFTWLMLTVIKTINSSTSAIEIKNASSIMIGIGLVMLAAAGTLWLINRLNIDAGDLLIFGILTAIIATEIGIVTYLSKSLTVEQGLQALMIMGGISLVMISAVMTMWMMREFGIDWDDLGMLGVLSAGITLMVGLMNLVSKGLDIQKATGSLILMSTIVLFNLAAIFIIKLIRNLNPTKDDLNKLWPIELMIAAEVGLMNLVTIGLDIKRATSALILIGAITLFNFGAIYALKLIADSGITKQHVGIIGLIELCVVGMLSIMVFAGELWKRDNDKIINGIEITGIMVVFMIGLTFAVSILGKSGIEWKHVLMVAVLEACLAGMIGIAALAGLAKSVVNKQSVLIVGALTLMILGLSIAISNIAKSGVEWKHVGILAVLEACVLGMVGIAAIVGIPAVAALVAIGTVVLMGIVGLMIGLTTMVMMIAKISKMDVEPKNLRKVSEVLNGFVDLIANLPLNPVKYLKLISKATMLTTLTLAMVPALLLMAKAIKSIANLRIEKLNPNGSVASYIQMGKAEFSEASENIKTIITTLAEGILAASHSYEKIDKKTLRRTLKATSELGSIIYNIATGVQAYAKLMIPDYDENGNIKGYHLMSKSEFKDAADNIVTIITVLGGAIARIANNKDENTKGWIDAMHKRDKKNKFLQVLNASTKLGDMISGISQGVTSFANWMIPTDWDENGHPIKYEKMTQAYINGAVENIQMILTTIPQALIALANDEEFSLLIEGKEKKSKITKTLNACIKIGGMIESIAKGIQEMANLKFVEEYDENGRPKKYMALTSQMIVDAADNIKLVLSIVMDAIIEKAIDLEEAPKKARKAFDALSSIGDIISGVASGVAAMAQLKFVSKYDENGNPIEYITLTEGDLTTAGENIAKLITTITGNIVTAYNDNEPTWKKIPQMVGDMEPIIDFIDNMADVIFKIAIGKYTINNEEKQIGMPEILQAKDNVSKMIESISDIAKTIMADDSPIIKLLENKKVVNNIDKISELVNIISTYADIIQKLNTLENLDNAIANVDKIIGKDNQPGLITKINGILDIKDLEGKKKEISNIRDFISATVPFYTDVFDFLNLINENKELFNLDIESSFANIVAIIGKLGAISDELDNVKQKTFTMPGIRIAVSIVDGVLSENLRKQIQFYTDIISLLGEIKDTATIDNLTNLSTTSQIMFDALFGVNSNINDGNVSTGSIFGIIQKLSNIKRVNSNHIMKLDTELNSFGAIVRALTDISNPSAVNSEYVANINSAITSITEGINTAENTVSNSSLGKWKSEVDSLDKFVKSIDTVDVSKIKAMNELMTSLNNLADRMGGIDKLADAFNDDLGNLIVTLAAKIDEAKNVINKASTMEDERKKSLAKNIEELKGLVTNPIQIEVGKLNRNNNITAGFEKQKK